MIRIHRGTGLAALQFIQNGTVKTLIRFFLHEVQVIFFISRPTQWTSDFGLINWFPWRIIFGHIVKLIVLRRFLYRTVPEPELVGSVQPGPVVDPGPTAAAGLGSYLDPAYRLRPSGGSLLALHTGSVTAQHMALFSENRSDQEIEKTVI